MRPVSSGPNVCTVPSGSVTVMLLRSAFTAFASTVAEASALATKSVMLWTVEPAHTVVPECGEPSVFVKVNGVQRSPG